MYSSHTLPPCQRRVVRSVSVIAGPTCSAALANARVKSIGQCPPHNESIGTVTRADPRTIHPHEGDRRPRRLLLWTHPLGWEIRLLVNDMFTRSQVVRDPADIQRIANEWRDAMIRDGWRTR